MLLLYADFILQGKDNARREENEMNVFISYPEPQLVLCKDNANRRQYKASLLVFIVEVSLVLLKDSIVFLKRLIISRFLLNFFLKWSYK